MLEKKIIKYHRLSDLLKRLENVWTTTNLNKEIICLPVDAYHINAFERYLYNKNKDIFNKVTFYSTDKVECNFENITFGTDILDNFSYYQHCDRKYNKAKHYLCLLGTPKPHRKNLFNFIFSNKLSSKGIVSSVWTGISPDIEKKKNTPKWDLNTLHDGTISKTQIYAKETLDEFYNNCAFEIVTESCSQLITEKTLKPLLYGVPFIFYGKMNNTQSVSLYKDSFKDTEMFDWVNVLENIEKIKLNYGIDVNYFNIDYKNENSIENKILELCNLDINELITKYKQTFKKAKQNQKIIKQYLNKYYEKIR